jgi:glucose 1-dehydrogenase
MTRARGQGELLVEGLALGVCGTDEEIVAGEYGWAAPGKERLVLGHESLGRVLQAAEGSGFAVGDLVVGVVRRPDPEPCPACARGEFDRCRNGRYTERGIRSGTALAPSAGRLRPRTRLSSIPGSSGWEC